MFLQLTKEQVGSGSRSVVIRAGTRPKTESYVTSTSKLVSDLKSGFSFSVNTDNGNPTIHWRGCLSGLRTPPALQGALDNEAKYRPPDFTKVTNDYLRSLDMSYDNLKTLSRFVDLKGFREAFSNGSLTFKGLRDMTRESESRAVIDSWNRCYVAKKGSSTLSNGWGENVESTDGISMTMMEAISQPKFNLWVRNVLEHGNPHYRQFPTKKDMAWYLLSRIKRSWDACLEMQVSGNDQRILPAVGTISNYAGNNISIEYNGKWMTMFQMLLLAGVWPQDWYNPALKYTRLQFFKRLVRPTLAYGNASIPMIVSGMYIPKDLGKEYIMLDILGVAKGAGMIDAERPFPVPLTAWPLGPIVGAPGAALPISETAFSILRKEYIEPDVIGALGTPSISPGPWPSSDTIVEATYFMCNFMKSFTRDTLKHKPHPTVSGFELTQPGDVVEAFARAITNAVFYEQVIYTADGFAFIGEIEDPELLDTETVGIACIIALLIHVRVLQDVTASAEVFDHFSLNSYKVRLFGKHVAKAAILLNKFDNLSVTAQSMDSERGTEYSSPILSTPSGYADIMLYNPGLPYSTEIGGGVLGDYNEQVIREIELLSTSTAAFAMRVCIPNEQLAINMATKFSGTVALTPVISPSGWEGLPLFAIGEKKAGRVVEPDRWKTAARCLTTRGQLLIPTANVMNTYSSEGEVGGFVGYSCDEDSLEFTISKLLSESSRVKFMRAGDSYMGVGVANQFRNALFSFIRPGSIDVSGLEPYDYLDPNLRAPQISLATAMAYGFAAFTVQDATFNELEVEIVIDVGGRNFRGAFPAATLGADEYVVIDPVMPPTTFVPQEGKRFKYHNSRFQDVTETYNAKGIIYASFVLQNNYEQMTELEDLVAWRNEHAPNCVIYTNVYGTVEGTVAEFLKDKYITYQTTAAGGWEGTFKGYDPVSLVEDTDIERIPNCFQVGMRYGDMLSGILLAGGSPTTACALGGALTSFVRLLVIYT